jgi:hypothetical protein
LTIANILSIIIATEEYLLGGTHGSNTYSYRQRNNVFAKDDRGTYYLSEKTNLD